MLHLTLSRDFDRQRTAVLWAAIASIAVAIHAVTLLISPTMWQDEVQIVEWGRLALTGGRAEWSTNWLPSGRPTPMLSSIGPVVQELAFRAAFPTPYGPRIVALLAAVLFGTVCLAWLRARGTPSVAALLVSVLVLLDPMLVTSYRGGRVDALGLAAACGGALLLRRGLRASPRNLRSAFSLVAGGMLAATAPLIWLSVALALPVLLVEIVEAILDARGSTDRRMRRVVLGSVLAGGAFLVTIGAGLLLTLANYRDLIGSPFDYLRLLYSSHLGPNVHREPSLLAPLARTIAVSPLVWLLFLLGVFNSRRRVALVLGVIAWAVILRTVVYVHRVVHLLPYAVLVAGALFEPRALSDAPRLLRRGRDLLLLGCVLWAVALSLVFRPARALTQAAERDPTRVYETAAQFIPGGGRSVFVGAWEFYYPGRWLGWRMYYLYGLHSEPSHDSLVQLLTRLDYAVVKAGTYEDALKRAGYVRMRVALQGTDGAAASWGASPYGPYALYARGR